MATDSDKLQRQSNDLSSRLWAIANDLRGGMDANEFIDSCDEAWGEMDEDEREYLYYKWR